MKLNLYTSRNYLPEGKKPTSLLFPFWGNPETDRNDTDFGRFEEYTRKGAEVFTLTDDPAAADHFLLPYEFSFSASDQRYSDELDELAAHYKKKVLVFFNSDATQPIPMKNAIVFRTSFYKSTQASNEFAFPGWSADFMKHRTTVPSFRKPERPSVSYCGYVDYMSMAEKFTLKNIISSAKGGSGDKIGPAIRGKAVRALISDRRVDCRFIIRKGFWAAGMDKKSARKEYVDNMFAADYAVVTRGAGNFSYRLYEVLSCGKIPVFINTDAVLPFDHIIDWKKYVVWIEENEIGSLADRLVDFHRNIPEEEFIRRGRDCRKLYEEWMSPLGFYSHLYKCLN